MLNILRQKINNWSAIEWFVVVLAAYFCLDTLSFLGWTYPFFGSVVCVIIALAWLGTASRNIFLGIVLLVIELVLGSQGYLFSFKFGGTVISLRLMLFLAAFILIVWRLIIGPRLKILNHQLLWWYMVLIIGLGWGSVVGLLRGNGFGNLFLDLNGYLYLGLFPLYFEAVNEERFILWLKRLLLPAIVWLGIKTLFALYLFSHFLPEGLLVFYQWWRQTGFGEITYVSGSFFRIFSQSQIWAALSSVAGLVYLWLQQTKDRGFLKIKTGPLIFLWFSLVILLASFSRSFWLGAAAIALIVPVITWRKIKFKRLFVYYFTSLILVIAAAGFLMFVTRLNWPISSVGATSADIFSQRLGAGEAAGQSRLNLLGPLWNKVNEHIIVGSGFGSTVTYKTSDPRIVRSTAGGSGIVTTYAFEWGYLDSWLKLGLIGLALYLIFITKGLWPVWYGLKGGDSGAIWSFMACGAVLALLITNMTTPYLNHPLGLGALMLAIVLIYSESAKIDQLI